MHKHVGFGIPKQPSQYLYDVSIYYNPLIKIGQKDSCWEYGCGFF